MGVRGCVDCKRRSPDIESDHALIGSAGWRVVQTRASTGGASLVWRCPSCWTTYKERTGLPSGAWTIDSKLADGPASVAGTRTRTKPPG
jgi:hypothetical protein